MRTTHARTWSNDAAVGELNGPNFTAANMARGDIRIDIVALDVWCGDSWLRSSTDIAGLIKATCQMILSPGVSSAKLTFSSKARR